MNHNVYLPDDVSERAKAAGLNLSRMLRDAVVEEFERSDAMATTLATPEVHDVYLEDDDGAYTGRITGTVIAEAGYKDATAYLTADRRVILYDGDAGKYWVIEAHEYQEVLRQNFPDSQYAGAMRALGLDPIIDL